MSDDFFDHDDDIGVNSSREATIADLIEARLSRRTALKGMAATSLFGLFGCAAPATRGAGAPQGSTALTFTEVGRFLDETAHVAPGYDTQVLIRWGDPVARGAPPFKPGAQTAQEQESVRPDIHAGQAHRARAFQA